MRFKAIDDDIVKVPTKTFRRSLFEKRAPK